MFSKLWYIIVEFRATKKFDELESNQKNIYNLIRTNLNGSWNFEVFYDFPGNRTGLNLSNPAEDSQGHKLSF